MPQAIRSAGPGKGLTSSQHREAQRAYLQDRVRIFYTVCTAAVVGFFVVSNIADVASDAWSVEESLLELSEVVHIALMLLMIAGAVALRRRSFEVPALRVFDAVGLLVGVGVAVSTYALGYTDGLIPLVIAALGTYVIARAVIVPSSAQRTFLLSLAAPLGILLVQLIQGPPAYVEKLSDHQAPFWIYWHLTVLLFAVAVATVASRVTFRLRDRVAEAIRAGEYQLEAKIGEGGMGEVYRARHAMLRRPTAIKFLRPELTGPSMLARFRQEVRLASRLSHPNSVQIFDYGHSPDGAFYYAMEYLDGATLSEIVEATGPMPPGRVLFILDQVLGALGEAHEKGLVHRDVKAANILLCTRGGEHDVVKVIDFGLAKKVRGPDPSETDTGLIAGTPEALAPEVLRGEAATPASDLYGLGVVGYRILTGKRVFASPNAADLMAHTLHSKPIPPRERLASVPEDLEALILACLAKDPAERPTSAGALRDAVACCRDAGTWTREDALRWWREEGALVRDADEPSPAPDASAGDETLPGADAVTGAP